MKMITINQNECPLEEKSNFCVQRQGRDLAEIMDLMEGSIPKLKALRYGAKGGRGPCI